MMRNRSLKYCIPIFVLGIAVLSCNRESLQPDSHEMVFSVQMAGGTKAAGLFTDTELSGLTEFNVTGYDGDSKVINDRTLYKVDGVWKFKDNPRAWLSGHTMTFWASANMPEWASVTSVSLASTVMYVTSIPTAIDEQCDPLIGYYSGTGDKGKAVITFYHPLTAIIFKTGSLGDEKYKITGIRSVKLKGAYKTGTGTATIAGGATEPSFSWSGSESVEVVGAFSGTQSAKPFLLIPQNLTTDKISLEVTVSRSEGGDKVMYASLNQGVLVAGKIHIYTLDYVNDKMEATLTVTLEDWGKVMNTIKDPDTGNDTEVDYFNATFN